MRPPWPPYRVPSSPPCPEEYDGERAVSVLDIRPAAACGLDAVALGEVMLRLDPGEIRIRAARRFDVLGGRGRVQRRPSPEQRVFGRPAGVVTALVDNEVGRLVEGLVRAGGVDTSLIRWHDFDGVGRSARNGLNFTERGFGVRSALGVSDRAGTAVSQLAPGTLDWRRRSSAGAACAGCTPVACSPRCRTARPRWRSRRWPPPAPTAPCSPHDTNYYRPSLWAGRGGHAAARALNTRLVEHVDVLVGGRSDLGALGPDDPDAAWSPPDPSQPLAASVEASAAALAVRFPRLQVVATTRRCVRSANDNDWQGAAWSRASGTAVSLARPHLPVLDRVGGGDGFAAGLAYGLLAGEDLATSVELGAAHGAVPAMSTPGDTSMATLPEVRALALGGDASTRR